MLFFNNVSIKIQLIYNSFFNYFPLFLLPSFHAKMKNDCKKDVKYR